MAAKKLSAKIKSGIMHKLEALARAYRKRNFYHRIMVPFAIFSTALICITTVIAWVWMNRRQEQKQRDSSLQILQQVQQYTDDAVYFDVFQFLNKVFLGNTTSYLDDFFVYGSRLPGDYALKTYQELVNLCMQRDYLENVTLYNAKTDMLLDNTYGLSYHASESSSRISQFLPIADYLNALTHATDDIIYLSGNSMSSGVRSDFTMIKLIPFHTNSDNAQGFVAFRYNETKLLAALYRRFGIEGELLVLTPDEQTVAQTAGFPIRTDTLQQKVLARVGQSDYVYFSDGGVRYCMLRAQSPQTGWIYLLCLPVRSLSAQAYMFNPVLLCLAFFAVLLCNVIVQWISKRIYQPIHMLSSRVQQQSALPLAGEELSVIEDALNFLESQMDTMQKVVNDNRDVLLHRTVIKLLNSEISSDEEIVKALELCGIHFASEGFCAVVTAFDSVVFQSLLLKEREYFVEKARELLKSWFRSVGISAVSTVYPDNQVVSVLNVSKEQYAILCDKAPELIVEFRNQLHIQTNHAVSDWTLQLHEVRRLYADCLCYLRYDFIYEFSNVFIPPFIRSLEHMRFSIGPETQAQLAALLNARRGDEAVQLFTAAVHQIQSGQASLQEANTFITEVYSIVVQECAAAGVFQDAAYKEQIERTIREAVTLTGSMECIDLMIQRCCAPMNPQMRTENIQLIDRISDYIRLHCSENITLPAVAEAFHIAPAHLSRLFKSVRGENFSNYVLNQKLDRAAELLVHSPEMSIVQVAESLGYYTPTYFTRLFKDKFGVTPSQYRRSNFPQN